MKSIYVCMCLILFYGCNSNEEKIQSEEEIIRALNAKNLSLKEKEAIVDKLNLNSEQFPYYQAFDTIAYLKKLNLKEEVNDISTAKSEKLDTFTLQYMAYACFCPQWLIVDSLSSQNPYQDGFYLIPGSKNIRLPDLFAPGTVITFIGRVEDNRNFDEPLSESDPIPDKELFYYYYKVHKPYWIWGERVFIFYNIDILEDTIKGEYFSRQIRIE